MRTSTALETLACRPAISGGRTTSRESGPTTRSSTRSGPTAGPRRRWKLPSTAVIDDLYVSENWDQLVDRGVEIFSLPGSHDWVAYDVPSTSEILPGLRTYIVPNGGHSRDGHPEAPGNEVNAGFFAEQLFGADGGLETPDISSVVNGDRLDVTVTFPAGGVPEDSRVFWMYDREPDGSSWYLYDLFPDDNWAVMAGSGSTWSVSIPWSRDARRSTS